MPALALHGAPRLPATLDAILAPMSASAAGAGLPGQLGRLLVASLTILWGGMAIFFLARIARDVAAARNHGGVPLEALDPALRSRVAPAASRAGIPPSRILISSKSVMPCVVGFARPVVCIPATLAVDLSDEELRAVLSHEEMHRRHREPLRLLIQRIAGALFCLYPPVHLVIARLQDASELACDEATLDSGIRGDDLGRALARIVAAGLAPTALSSSATGANHSLFRERLKRLSNPRRYSMLARHRIAVAATLALVAAVSILPVRAPALAPEAAAVAADSAASDTISAPPEILKMISPEYPDAARKAGIEGTFYLKLTVGVDGKPKNITVDKRPGRVPELEAAALEAAKGWIFKPAECCGKPREMEVTLPVRFRLH